MANDVSGPKDWRTGHHKTCSASLRSCPGPPEWGRYGGPSPAALGQRRSRRQQPLPRHANFKQSLGRRGSLGEEESLGLQSPSRSHRLTHTQTHTRSPPSRAPATPHGLPNPKYARTPGPAEFCISSSSKLLLRSQLPLSARIPGPPKLGCPRSLKARPVRPLSDAGIIHRSPLPPFLVPAGTSACPREAGIY